MTIQEDYLRVDPSTEEPDDDDVDYSNDDLGENTEITPLGEEVEDSYNIDPDDDDDIEGDDLDIDVDDEDIEEDDQFIDQALSVDPDEEFDDDDDLLADDDDLDQSIAPDLDDDDDLLSDDDDDLDLDDDEDFDDETNASTSLNDDVDFSSRPHGRVTGTMLDHEPGTSGLERR